MKKSFMAFVAVSTLTLGAMLATVVPAASGTFDVMRSATLVDGTYVPALAIMVDGELQVIPVGAMGLTRDIVFDQRAATKYASIIVGTRVNAVTALHAKDPMVVGDESNHSW